MSKPLNREEIKRIYKNQAICFPMIMGVIEGTSEGMVYCDDAERPKHLFVRNKFGFCQEFFESFSEGFFRQTVVKILEDARRPKLRMYLPTAKTVDFLRGNESVAVCERVHFKHNAKNIAFAGHTAGIMKNAKFSAGGGYFGLIARYYRDENEFMENAMPVVAYDENKKEIGVIYNTAKGDGNCEVDVLVEEQYRKRGIGKALVQSFIELCQEKGLVPNWDCYSNNVPSMKLAERCGFEPVGTYPFYNIDVFSG